MPQALQDAGGWLNRRMIDWFAEYAVLMVKNFGDRVKYWTTFNEPWVISNFGYGNGSNAPGGNDRATIAQVNHHLFLAHGAAVRACREIRPELQYGIVNCLIQCYPDSESPADRAAVESEWTWANRLYIEPILLGRYPEEVLDGYREKKMMPVILDGDMEKMSPPLDFMGINHYFSNFIRAGKNGEPDYVERIDIPRSDLEWPIYPDGMRDLLIRIQKDYGMPLYITENGVSLQDSVESDGQVHDSRRVEYIRGFVRAAHQAVKAGVDLRGYMVWSLMDNFEWALGYGPRFGMVYVDYGTQKRTLKDSARFYRKIIKKNGLEIED
jgi:beta-glucosidase